MRFGFSPGWVGRSTYGLGPCAQYFMYGQWPTPQMDYYWQTGQIPLAAAPVFPMPGFPTPYDPWGATQLTQEQELDILKGQAEWLEDELGAVSKRIGEIEGGEK